MAEFLKQSSELTSALILIGIFLLIIIMVKILSRLTHGKSTVNHAGRARGITILDLLTICVIYIFKIIKKIIVFPYFFVKKVGCLGMIGIGVAAVIIVVIYAIYGMFSSDMKKAELVKELKKNPIYATSQHIIPFPANTKRVVIGFPGIKVEGKNPSVTVIGGLHEN